MRNLVFNRYRLKFSEYAEEDLNEIHDYISKVLKEPVIAKRLILKIEEGMSILETSPYGCREIHFKRDLDLYRRLVIGKYIVLYTIEETKKEILIFHIFYGKRDYLVIDN